jgi:hypothetical protein
LPLVKELVDFLEEFSRTGGSDDEPVLFDIFTYACGKWQGSRPPAALPCHLWFTPREAFGTWVELDDDAFFDVKGSWTRIIHSVFYGGADEDRIVPKDEWDNQVQFEKDEEELRQQRKTTNEIH